MAMTRSVRRLCDVATGRRAKGRKGERVRESAAQPVPALPTRVSAYLAPENLEDEVAFELGEVLHRHGRLLLAEGAPRATRWAQDVWLDARVASIESIGDAARTLKEIQRNWVGYVHGHHRRSALLADKLPPVRIREHAFPVEVPQSPLGAYTLLDRDTLLYSPTRASPFPHGELRFVETREPPSRAYLKLWELFTRIGVQPAAGERCIDMGASPGGWTWVLAQLGANVYAVDKAPIASELAEHPNVKVAQQSAFAVDPRSVEPYDWFFSDVICEPARLLSMIQRWLEADAAKRFVCSVKFRGATDHASVAELAAIEGAQLMHLWHNRHELTWVRL